MSDNKIVNFTCCSIFILIIFLVAYNDYNGTEVELNRYIVTKKNKYGDVYTYRIRQVGKFIGYWAGSTDLKYYKYYDAYSSDDILEVDGGYTLKTLKSLGVIFKEEEE